MKDMVQSYFACWKDQDIERLRQVFNEDAVYRVHPFGREEYRGIEEIIGYWNNAVMNQVNPKPRIITELYGKENAFLEWETKFTTPNGAYKSVRGMMLLEFTGGKIRELREHYDVVEL